MTDRIERSASGRGRVRASLGWLVVCAAVAACDDFPSAPRREPHVDGWVTRIRVVDSATRLIVEEFPERSVGSADPGTKIELVLDPVPDIVVVLPDGRRRRGDLFDPNPGVRVRAWAGHVDESHPAVGNAVFIEVHERR